MAEEVLCISCGKCAAGCPARIDIPAYLAAYFKGDIGENVSSVGEPLDCIECGYCSMRCPQEIDVLSIIRKMAMDK